VTSAGWRPHAQQVGQTGTRIAPDLYIACGISGAIQHMVGARSAKAILAINTDRDAPMVTRATYAVIGESAYRAAGDHLRGPRGPVRLTRPQAGRGRSSGAVQQGIVQPLAICLLRGEFEDGDTIVVDSRNDELESSKGEARVPARAEA